MAERFDRAGNFVVRAVLAGALSAFLLAVPSVKGVE